MQRQVVTGAEFDSLDDLKETVTWQALLHPFLHFSVPQDPTQESKFSGEKNFFFPIFRIFAKAKLAHTNRFFVQKMTGEFNFFEHHIFNRTLPFLFMFFPHPQKQ